LYANTTGQKNTAIGRDALGYNVEGNKNIAIGDEAGKYFTDEGQLTTSYQSIFIGAETKALKDTSVNEIVIGYNAIGNGDSTVTIGDSSIISTHLQGNVGIGTSAPPTHKLDIESGHIRMREGAVLGYLPVSDADGVMIWTDPTEISTDTASIIADADRDTRIQVEEEEGIDDDIIRFDMAGTEFFRMDSGRLEVVNTGHSVFIGAGAGENDNFLDNNNVAIGDSALHNSTESHENTAVGKDALYSTTVGSYNTAVGRSALYSNERGSNNVAIGYQAMYHDSLGMYNTAIGTQALYNNYNVDGNTAVGYSSLYFNVDGKGNSAYGKSSLYFLNFNNKDGGNNNTAIGNEAGKYFTGGAWENKLTTSNQSIFIGAATKALKDTSVNEIVIGYNAIGNGDSTVTIGDSSIISTHLQGNVGIGTSAPTYKLDIEGGYIRMREGATAGYIAISDNTGVMTWTDPTGISTDTASIIADADRDTKIQVEKNTDEDIIRFTMANTEYFRMDSGRLEVLNTGNSVFIGDSTGLNDDQNNRRNVFIGSRAGMSNTSGFYNTATGYRSFYSNTSGNANTATGSDALSENTIGMHNTATGFYALLKNTTGMHNTATGSNALHSNTEGHKNTALGFNANSFNKTGSNNVALGYQANYYNETGSNNVALGHEAGKGGNGKSKSGGVFLGYQAGYSETEDNKLYISNDSLLPLIYGDFEEDSLHINGHLKVLKTIQIEGGSPDTGYVLTSLDANGLASWTNPTETDTLGLAGVSDVSTDTLKSIYAMTPGIDVLFVGDYGTVTITNKGQLIATGKNKNHTNSAIGYEALTNNGGINNTATGYQVLSSSNNTGSNNTATGSEALSSNTSGTNNTATGSEALSSNKGGRENTATGSLALNTNTTGNYNTAIGSGADVGSDDLINATAIGANAIVSQSHSLVLGDAANVGIGTSTPISPLEINKTLDQASLVTLINNSSNGGSILTATSNSTGDTNIVNIQNNAFVIEGNGRVGIGTSTPISSLEINKTLDQASLVTLINNSNNGGNILTATSSSTGTTDIVDIQNGAFVIEGNGRVGIGTDSPMRAKLEVIGSEDPLLAYAFYAYNGSGTAFFGEKTGSHDYSIYTDQSIAASQFNAFSDARAKSIKGLSDASTDLSTLMKIEITDYTMKDEISKGNAPNKKVIAQQVKEVYPQAVQDNITEVVPDIYQKAEVESGWIVLTTDLQAGDRVKLITENASEIYEVQEVKEHGFRVVLPLNTDKVFVYGREVDDFHTVDYEAISMLNVSATQEQQHIIEAQQAEIEALKAKVNEMDVLKADNIEMKAENKEIKAEIENIKSVLELINDN
ncbi:MAG: hypothetical protein GY834_06720, partial [Bacteroidetes bacterium]|nr:hypothetical protein [Bacteroidota bacterium]